MTRELTIKIQLDDNAAYQAKTEALLPVLGLLLECDEKNISYAVEEVKPERKDVSVTLKGRVLISASYEMSYQTYEGSAVDYEQGVLDILGDMESETQIINGSYAKFSHVNIDSVLSAQVVKIEEV